MTFDLTYSFLDLLNRTKVHNKNIINNVLENRPKQVPLITVSNHHSCFDDPGIWGRSNFFFIK